MQEKILGLIFEQNDVTWQTMLYQLVKQEGMNPWDVDVSRITQHYLEMLKTMKELDFRISGKVVLAAALLVRIKATRLLGDDLDELDRLLAGPQDSEDFYEDLEEQYKSEAGVEEHPELFPRTPQPRARKVSIYDLVRALQKALEVRQRRLIRSFPKGRLEVPEQKIDINKLIDKIYAKVMEYFEKNSEKLTYQNLVQEDTRKDKILAFMGLLHLAHVDSRKLDLIQAENFGDIEIKAVPKKEEAASNPAPE